MPIPGQTEFAVRSHLLNYLILSESRPGMYFGSARVHLIRKFLDGWRAHRQVMPDNDPFAELFFDQFHAFVERHYGDQRTIGWDGLIAENSSDTSDEFAVLMTLVREFAKLNFRRVSD